jgi:hypothetical protein
VRVLADFDDLDFAWGIIRECAEELTGAGWVVELREPPRLPGLYVTGRAAPAVREEEETSMTEREQPRVGDLVTIPGTPVDAVTRTGRVEGVMEARGALELTLRSVPIPSVVWTETYAADRMVVTYGTDESRRLLAEAAACDHEVTGGYVYTGDPAGSRSMEVTVRYPGESRTVPALDHEGLWVTVVDEEGMECELQVKGLTDVLTRAVIADTDRYNGRGEKYSPAEESPLTGKGLLRALMSQYLDTPHAQRGVGMGEALLTHAVMVAYGWSQDRAGTWLAEELQEMLAARG